MAKKTFDVQAYRPIPNHGHPKLDQNSLIYQDYWEEEMNRCINGYKPIGGDWIPGNYYWYLNYYMILGNDGSNGNRKTLIYPWYRDMDKEYFMLFDTCRKEGKGMIVIKARDKGFSYMNSGLVGHEFTFFPHSEVGIAAGLGVTANSFFEKTKKGLMNQHPNFRHGWLKDTKDVLRAGYRQKNAEGRWEISGYQSVIHCRTMDDPEVYKGERLSIMIFEEAGEFKRLKNAYMSSRACFMDGALQYGVPIVGGTGGDIDAASADFMDMYYNPDAFNLIPMFIPASRALHGFFSPNTGVDDEQKAYEYIESERTKILEGGGDSKAYNLHLQNYPLTIQEAFLKTKGSRFDIALLNQQRGRVQELADPEQHISTGNIDWVIDENGLTNEVKFTPHPFGPYKILHEPQTHMSGLDIGGIDSYDQDQAGAAPSLGCAMIFRRIADTNQPYRLPVAEYTDRPETAEMFFEGCLKLAVYYNAQMLVEYTKIGILDYFLRNKAQKYLKTKPRSAHSPGTKTRNNYGVHMNKQVKGYMESLMYDYIKERGDEIWFIDLLNELCDWGSRNTDRAVAFGLCLIHENDNFAIEVKNKETETIKDSGFVYYKHDSNGTPIKHLR